MRHRADSGWAADVRAVAHVVFLLSLPAIFCACGASSPTSPSGTNPRIRSLSPNEGSTFGGTPVTIGGDNFTDGETVTFGDVAATDVVVKDSHTITATTPAHPAGSVDILLTTNQGRIGSLFQAFTYIAPIVSNAPPILESLTALGLRRNEPSAYATVGEPITVTAIVTDNETPVSNLGFEWSCDAGTFAGAGSSVTWQAPGLHGSVMLRLRITEHYSVAGPTGLPEEAENVTTGAIMMDVHDEAREVGDMAKDFLVLFSQSSVGPDDVLHNFQDGCGAAGLGRQDEWVQTVANRQNFLITQWFVGEPRVTVDFRGISPFRGRPADGWAAVDVDWVSQCLRVDTSIDCPSIGATRHDHGVDWVTAHYDVPTNRWWLCDSDYQGALEEGQTRYLR